MKNEEIIKGINNAEWNGEGNPLYSYDQMLSAMDAARKDEAQWHPMEEAPKEVAILIATGFGDTVHGFYDTLAGWWATMDECKIIHPIAWTHLPIYNPQNKEK